MTTTGISLKNISLCYEQQPLFEGLNVHFSSGCWHSILGDSGVGKSTLLKLIAGLIAPASGEVLGDENQPIHQQIAWMAQDDLLFPWLNVIDNICVGHILRHTKSPQIIEKAHGLLSQVGLEGFEKRMPAQLSGGQKQRIALARTLMEDKPIVLIDEPFSALDVMTRLQVQQLFIELLEGKTVLLVTHDPLEALRLSQTVWLMQGQPVRLYEVAHLSSKTPRAVDDTQVLQLQNMLLEKMRLSSTQSVLKSPQ